MRDIVQILEEEVISKIDMTFVVKEVVGETLSDIDFTVCSMKWLKVGYPFLDANNEAWQIGSIDPNTGVINCLKPSNAATLKRRQVLTIAKPIVFVHGTRKTANNEWLMSIQSDVRLGVPLIWLQESINENKYEDDSSNDYDSSLRLFFLDEIDVVNSLNDEQRDQGVRPMLGLMEAFYDALKESYKLKRNGGNFQKTISRFGVEDNDGIIRNILDANLGGVEARPTLTIYKTVECCS